MVDRHVVRVVHYHNPPVYPHPLLRFKGQPKEIVVYDEEATRACLVQ